jgi:hypothetical protein
MNSLSEYSTTPCSASISATVVPSLSAKNFG